MASADEFFCIENSGYKNLTKGKIYVAKSWTPVSVSRRGEITIIDDNGQRGTYPMFLFGKADEWRTEGFKKLFDDGIQ